MDKEFRESKQMTKVAISTWITGPLLQLVILGQTKANYSQWKNSVRYIIQRPVFGSDTGVS